jgi:hypothetical protein
MVNFLTITFLVFLLGLTLLAIRMWYKMKGTAVSEDERRLYGRFLIGVAIFWLVAIVGYFGGPLLSGIK